MELGAGIYYLTLDDFNSYENLLSLQTVWVTADALMDGAMGIVYDAAVAVTRTFGSSQN